MVARSSDYTPTFAGAYGTTLLMSLSLIMLGNSGSRLSTSNSMRLRLPELRPAEWSTVAANSVPHPFADRARAPRVHRRQISALNPVTWPPPSVCNGDDLDMAVVHAIEDEERKPAQ